MEFEDLMAAFGRDVGIAGLGPERDGVCSIEVDGMRVSFLSMPGTGQLVTWADVCAAPPEGREQLYQTLMEAMFMGRATNGAMFAVPAGGETICLQRFDALATLELDGFKAMLEAFVNDLEHWQKFVAEFRDVANAIDADKEQEAAVLREVGLGDGIRV